MKTQYMPGWTSRFPREIAMNKQPTMTVSDYTGCVCKRTDLVCIGFDGFTILLVAAGLLVAGCSQNSTRKWKDKWRYYSANENYKLALEADDGDLRREAVIRIAESSYVSGEDAFSVLDAVARTDSVAQTRCIAIRALAGYSDDRPVATMLKIWQAHQGTDQALPPDNDIRWEVALALQALERKAVLKGTQRDLVRDLFVEMLKSGPTRNVSIVAAETLGSFKDRMVLPPLIVAIRNRDFALADRAERSLIALTGTTHYYDADAWEKWLAGTQDPFANAGKTPQTTQPAGPTWWDHQKRTWRRALKMGTED